MLTKSAQETIDGSSNATACIALGSREPSGCGYDADCAAACIDDGGSTYHSAGVPDAVRKDFCGKHGNKQDYISLGSDGRFFIRRETGHENWHVGDYGDEEFEDYVRGHEVKQVAFGSHDSSWFVLTPGGGYQYNAPPRGFTEAHSSNKYKKKVISDVSWGPDDEWWVRFSDGTWKVSDNCTVDFDEKIVELKRDGWDIKKVIFGPDQQWVIRYDQP